MPFFNRLALSCFLTAAVALPAAVAEELATPAFKTPAEGSVKAKSGARSGAKPGAKAAEKTNAKSNGPRRPGELEGWDSGAKTPAATPARARPADAIGERKIPDGGLPLPERRFTDEPGMGRAPVSIDQNGNMGGAFRF